MKISVVDTHNNHIGRMRILLYLIAAFLFIILVMSFLVEWYLEKMFFNALENQKSEVTIQAEGLDVDMLSRSIEISGIEVFLKDDTINRLLVRKMGIDNFKIFPFLFHKQLMLKKISIAGPVFAGDAGAFLEKLKHTPAGDTADVKTGRGPEMIYINEFSVENFMMNAVNFPHTMDSLSFLSANFMVRDLVIRISKNDTPPNIIYDAVFLDVKGLKTAFKNSLYSLHLSSLAMNSEDSSFSVDTFMLIPLYDEHTFGWKNRKQTDRFQVFLSRLDAFGINLREIVEKGWIDIPHVRLANPDIRIYRDKNVPFDYEKFPLLPQSVINTINIPLSVGNAEIIDANIDYQEVSEGNTIPGKVFLSDFNVSIENFHNKMARRDHAANMIIRGYAFLYNAGKLDIEIIMPMNAEKDTFSFAGSLSTMEVRPINKMSIPNGRISLQSGVLDSVIFRASANSDFASGSIKIIYKDLEIDLLKDENDEDGKGFLTALAQTAIVSSNPHGNRPPRIGDMYFRRDKNKGLINFMWKTVFSGIKATLNPFGHAHKEGKRKKKSG